ncbi:MAG: hypothetical protein NTZ09_03160 [Candidatus Hydrogenedentes bacterium]|nr:hypothetical protein [Candidatus Hydrogenedentota bacterium]
MSWRQVIEGCSFELVAKADRLALDIWWNSEQNIELHTLDLGRGLILRGTKTYFVKALSEEGELLARDIEPFHEWLETHFSNVRMSLTYLRDISRSLAIQRIREKGFRETRSDDVLEHG